MNPLFVFALFIFSLTAQQRALCESFIIVDNRSGQILAASNEKKKVQVASLTKIATASVILDMVEMGRIALSDLVTINALAMRAGGANPVGLQEGDQVTVRDLLYCSLLASDNIAATALAHYAGARIPNPERLPPVANFVSHMNALARLLGMKRTLFLNPTGMDGGEGAQPYSTAADLARLTRHVYQEADIPYYVSQASREIKVLRDGQELAYAINNTNVLLGKLDIDGVKTGQTSRSGGCLILSSELPPEVSRQGDVTYVTPRRIHVVLLGSRDRFSRGMELTRLGWQLYKSWARSGRKLNKPL